MDDVDDMEELDDGAPVDVAAVKAEVGKSNSGIENVGTEDVTGIGDVHTEDEDKEETDNASVFEVEEDADGNSFSVLDQ